MGTLSPITGWAGKMTGFYGRKRIVSVLFLSPFILAPALDCIVELSTDIVRECATTYRARPPCPDQAKVATDDTAEYRRCFRKRSCRICVQANQLSHLCPYPPYGIVKPYMQKLTTPLYLTIGCFRSGRYDWVLYSGESRGTISVYLWQ